MNRARLNSAALEAPRNPIRTMLRPRENQHRVETWIAKKVQEQRRFEMWTHFVDKLRHRLRGIGAATDFNNFRRALEIMTQRFDSTRDCRGKHQRLSFPPQLFHKLSYPLANSIAACLGELAQDGQDKGRCLSGPGLRDADDIPSGKHLRNRGRLNRSRLSIAGFFDSFGNSLVKT